ncbi:MAG: hypothetical protein ACFHWX_18045 [Bacteroidota bacterium]
MSTKAIILIKAIKDTMHYAFDYPLEHQLMKISNQVFTIDSFTDRSLVQPIIKLIDESEKSFLILDNSVSSDIGIGKSILNACIKKNIDLICLGEPGNSGPFLKLFNGKVFSSEQEVVDYISSN